MKQIDRTIVYSLHTYPLEQVEHSLVASQVEIYADVYQAIYDAVYVKNRMLRLAKQLLANRINDTKL